MKRTIIVLALLVATLAMPLLVMHNAEAQSYPNLSIEIGGPNNLAINATSRYSITMSGGPAQGVQDGWWSYEATLEMSNQTGNPKVTPAARNGTTNVFIINVTAPAEEQVMLLRVTGTSNSLTENQSRETVYEIKIVRPLVLSTTVTNNGEVSVSNVPVVFYANGREVAKTTVSLSPGETKKVSVNWTT
ncbi:MAG: CARDB domain-containing protein, partial [Candidatus Thermoplasmatota archaeon]|nr:CARDB domain-containing protein [Candidatus Thermoplasmatota archaeon]